jgi:hypothetical protein
MVLGFVGSVQAALVHEWDFNGNTSDTSGSGNHGTLSGTSSYVNGVDYWKTGSGQALSLDGSTKVEDLTASNLPIAGTGAYTNRAATFSMNVFVYQDASASWLEAACGMGDYTVSPANNAYLGTYYGEAWARFGARLDVWEMPYNKWSMLTLVCPVESNPVYSEMKFYIDGVFQESTAVATGNFANKLRVGWANNPEGDSSPNWSGLIDGFQVYNHALDQSEIDALYSRIPEPMTIALLGLGGLVLLRRKS